MQRLLVLLVVLVMGGAAGYAAGRYTLLYDNPMLGVEIPAEPAPSPLAGKSRIIDALLVPDAFERMTTLASLSGLSLEEVGDIKEALLEVAIDRDLPEAVMMVRLWARQDPEAAARWAFAGPRFDIRPPLVTVAVEEWATRAPQAAADGVDGLTQRAPGEATSAAETALMRGWFDSGSYQGVEAFLRGRGVGFDRQRAIKAFVRRMVQRAGPETAIGWSEAVNDEELNFKLAVYRLTAEEVAKVDPQVAVQWCEKVCDGEYGSELEKKIAVSWVARDGQAAIEWLSTMEEGLERDTAILKAYRVWWQRFAGERGGEARRWLESIGFEGFEPWMAPTVQVYAAILAREDPREAAKWALLAPESRERRKGALISVYRQWRRQDEAAADAWLETSPLDEEAREQARKTHARLK